MRHRNALTAYRAAAQDLLVEGATPHRLIQILFTELLGALDAAHLAYGAKDFAERSRHASKALGIVHALAVSLDHDKGGEIADHLAALYDWARRKILEASRTGNRKHLAEARDAIAEIAQAWESIAAAPARAA